MQRKGLSYAARVAEINRIFEQHARTGLSNREIWRRYIYPRFFISERTLYNMLKAPSTLPRETTNIVWPEFQFPD